jgi:signal transduction histidine kinase
MQEGGLVRAMSLGFPLFRCLALAAILSRVTQAVHPTYVTYVADRPIGPASLQRRTTVKRSHRLTPIVLALGAFVVIAVLVRRAWPVFEQPAWLAVPVQLVGVPFIIGGTALWIQRQGNYLGPVCVLLGCVWYIGDLQAFDAESLFVVGFVAYHLNVVVFTHLALMVPSGRLIGRWERLTVYALYIVVPLTQFFRYLEVRPLIDRSTFGNVTAYYSVWARVTTYIGVPLAIGAVVLVIRHFRQATPIQRRSFGLFWVAAATTGLSAAAAAVAEFWPSPLPQQLSLLCYAVSLMAAAIGLALGTVAVTNSARRAWSYLAGNITDLEHAIAAAVGDPGLRLYVRELGHWVRREKRLKDEPAAEDGRARTVLFLDGAPAATMVHDRELAYQSLLLQAVAAMAVAAIARQRLTQNRDAAVADGQNAERERIKRDLHDDAQTPIASLIRRIGNLRVVSSTPDRADQDELIRDAARLQQRLVQIVHDIYPTGLRKDGLAAAISARLRGMDAHNKLKITVDIPHLPSKQRWPERIELAAYFLISEGLQNVVKHSDASRAWISAREKDSLVVITIDDDGRGWPPTTGDVHSGSGLLNMRTRVELLHGTFRTDVSPHDGARVQAFLPIPPNSDA